VEDSGADPNFGAPSSAPNEVGGRGSCHSIDLVGGTLLEIFAKIAIQGFEKSRFFIFPLSPHMGEQVRETDSL